MSALKLIASSSRWSLFRNVRSLNCALSPGYGIAHEWHRSTEVYRWRNTRSLPVVCAYRLYSSKKPLPGVTNNVVPEVKIEEKPNVQDIVQPLIDDEQDDKKLGLFKRFKLMYKKYWYVLIPVHVVTSIGWFGSFYYLSISGVDVPALLQTMHISESIVDKVKDSHMGHVAIAYLMYKVATPVRYAVTLGGTTFAINYLSRSGYIKPVPTKTQLMKIYEDKKADRVKRKQEKIKFEIKNKEKS